MTDQEVICAFMEPRPALPDRYEHLRLSPNGWWVLAAVNGGGMKWIPARNGRSIDLGALREVEERLTEEQWDAYEGLALKWRYAYSSSYRAALHASAEQKIIALASVLRPVVEGRR